MMEGDALIAQSLLLTFHGCFHEQSWRVSWPQGVSFATRRE